MAGVIIHGKSEDGSDAKIFEGVHVSPNGKFWGNQPISLQKERELEEWNNLSRRERRARERRNRYRK